MTDPASGEHPRPYLPSTPPVPRTYRGGWWVRRATLLLSIGLCLALGHAYYHRPDAAAAVTIFPVWAWLAPGLLLALAGWSPWRSRAAAAVFILWVAFFAALADEPASILRARSTPIPRATKERVPGTSLRVISLNCAVGSGDAVSEVIAYRPDVVLLQESPRRSVVVRLARDLFGKEVGVAWGSDVAVIARGRVSPLRPVPGLRGYALGARVRPPGGGEFHAVSVHLVPPVAREDLWNPDCWRQQRENRQARSKQMRPLAKYLGTLAPEVPLIVGGDWNAPAGDAIYRPLRPRLHDTFAQAGLGWGNTVLNDFPALRIDAVWASAHFAARGVFAHRTLHSDHRMVICDLQALSSTPKGLDNTAQGSEPWESGR